jgi:hypothetical protein
MRVDGTHRAKQSPEHYENFIPWKERRNVGFPISWMSMRSSAPIQEDMQNDRLS